MAENLRIGNYWVNLFIGIIGMLITCYGNLLPYSDAQKACYLIGSLFLFTSSSLERQPFFIILQIIIASGAAIAFAPIPALIKESVPSILSIMALGYFYKQGQLKDKLTIAGVIAIAILAVGYAITEPIIYFSGSFLMMFYSLFSFRRGVKIALVWAILNAVFVITAGIDIYRYGW